MTFTGDEYMHDDRAWDVDGAFRVSPFNIRPELHEGYDWPDPFTLIDSTLRKTLFTAGTVTSIDGFLRIAEQLALAGVRHECLNVDWTGATTPPERQLELVRAIGSRDFGFSLNVFADTLLSDGVHAPPVGMRETAELLVDLGADTLAPGIVPAADADARARQMDELEALFDVARGLGVGVTITVAQVGLRDLDEMVSAANRAIELGALRIDLMDSVSSLGPEAMKSFVRAFRDGLVAPVPLTMHTHDDFGLATACTIAAATAGASPDVAAGGVSYRCGFAAMEEVTLALETLYGVRTGIDLSALTRLARTVAEESGLPIPPLKPVVGRYAYLRHMPRDVAAALRDGPDAFPPPSSCVAPEMVGGRLEWVWDSLGTDDMAAALAQARGETLSAEETTAVRRALDAAVAAIERYPRWLEPERVTEIVDQTLADLRGRGTVVPTGMTEPAVEAGVAAFDALDARRAAELAYACCCWAPWADRLTTGRPYRTWDALDEAACKGLASLDEDSLATLIDKHPPIGTDTGNADLAATFSTLEQSSLGTSPTVQREMARLNDDYRARFGFTYLVASEGRSGDDLVADIRRRMENSRSQELSVARAELTAIVRTRLRRTAAVTAP
ncbi:2-oxo-4-hydroxy-4-carboxy-5-ureidoimidazoline decarboxylase [Actinomadura macra]|uniref:2-oxo-4-hydroxy-4-carboxy-5-ureidoimidazoline decarboxylase n=1 Tax=Actinomadura macra TaxID=46164 RepID=UPI00082E9B52|nr:2-oxo-4-hydroxy-4-carboxy-5-ureidoimidazoline decarboxylase [Actinomadura macra]